MEHLAMISHVILSALFVSIGIFLLLFFLLLCTRNDTKTFNRGIISSRKNFRWRRCWRLLRGNFVGVLHNIYFNEYQMCEFLHILNDIINVTVEKKSIFILNLKKNAITISMSQKLIFLYLYRFDVPCELTTMMMKKN